MVQTRSSSKKNTTDTNIEVNRDVSEASNKNTMNQNKRKTTTAQAIEASKKKTKKVVNTCDAGTLKKSKSSENSKSAVGVYEGKVIVRPITEEGLARNAFMLEYRRKYFEKHPGVIWLPDEEKRVENKKVLSTGEDDKSKIVEE